jgi:putative membrane protein
LESKRYINSFIQKLALMALSSFFQSNSFASSTSRGLVAGFVGGLAGTAVKSLVEHFLPVRKVEQRSAQIKIVDDLSTKITGTPISAQNEELAEQLVNFPFGASIGAAYGYGKRDKDNLKVIDGAIFGATTWASTHETSLPILGLEAKPIDVPVKMQVNELLAHVLFGITTEVVRSYVNERLKQ